MVAETLDLFLPFGLERGGRDHQDPPDAAAPAQQLARGDGLDGLARPHVVGQQGPFAEGRMQDARALTVGEWETAEVSRVKTH